MQRLLQKASSFANDEHGGATIELLTVFLVFIIFLLMIIESGIYSVRHVMLERGVDLATRSVRIGLMEEPTSEKLRDEICRNATVIPNCADQLAIEMVVRDPRNWQRLPLETKCIDRSLEVQPSHEFTQGKNNELVFLKACARFNPILPTTGLGKAIVDGQGSTDAAGGSYALVAVSAFVAEPFKDEEDDS